MISYKHSCIFVHIPKTGGTSIEDIIWPLKEDRVQRNLWMGFIDTYHNKYQTGGMQHLLAKQIHQEIGDNYFNQFFKFTIVRNPWDKIVSQFVYIKKREDLREFIGMKEYDNFKQYLSLIKKKKHVQWEDQYRFFIDENGEQLVDYVGRFETFQHDVKIILKKINMNIYNIPHANKSERAHYKEYYDQESAEMLQEMYKEDINLFGYRF